MQLHACSAKTIPETSFMLSMWRTQETSSKRADGIRSSACCMSVLLPQSVYQTSGLSLQLKISASTSTVRASTITYPSTKPRQRLQKESHRDLMLSSSIQRDCLDPPVLSSGAVKSFESYLALEFSAIHQAEFVLCT